LPYVHIGNYTGN